MEINESSPAGATQEPSTARTKPSGLSWVHASSAIAVAAVATLGWMLSAHRKQAEANERRERAADLARGVLVEVEQVRRAPATRQITANGEVHAYRESTLYAKVSGYLKLVRVDKGDRVRADEVLGLIEAPEVEQQIASKKADVAIKKLTDARLKSLAGSGVVSQEEMEKAAADVEIASADLARLNAIRGYQVIRAPFAGVVTARYADPGALLQAATSSQSALPLVRIADLDRVRVDMYLGQNEALLVHEGDPVTVWADARPDLRVDAKITRFSRELEPRTRTMLTEVELDNRQTQFYPGAFVRVKLTLNDRPSVVIPADAVTFDAGRSVAAVARDGRAHYVPIEIADTDGVVVRLRPGTLKEGDEVILHPGDEVVDGAAIRIAPTTATSTARPSAGAPVPSSSGAAEFAKSASDGKSPAPVRPR